jgi:type I restriction enzyme M protein
MNTLSNEFYRGFKVCTTLVDTHHLPYYTEFTEPEQSRIWLHDLKGKAAKPTFNTPFESVRAITPINGIQGTLF